MPTTNLPPRNPSGPFAQLSTYGAWERAGDLNGLASALKIGADRLQADDIKSIPDAWAQVQVFQQALLEQQHEMHDDVRNQWRGLLALLALQPEFKTVYEIDVKPLRLSDVDGAGRRLRRVLKDLEPTRALIDARDVWDSLGIVYFRERTGSSVFAASNPQIPAALLSPMVLVAAGKSRARLISENVPWLKHGLTDPLAVAGLTPRHYAVLARFLEALALDLDAKVGSGDNAGYTALKRELGQYHRGCSDRVKESVAFEEVDLGVRWPHPIYGALGRTYALGDAPPDRSDRRLQVRPEFTALDGVEGLKGAILIDPDEPHDDQVMVWKNYSLRAAKAPTTLKHIREEAIAEGWLIVQPEDLFTHDLVRFGEGVNIPAHGRRGFDAALMPLSPLALMLMTPEDLAQSVTLTQRGEECVVTLDLPIAAGQGRPRRHKLTRRYDADSVKDEDRPDDLAVWPNFRRRDWEWNFLRFQYDPEYEIQPRFGASAEFIAAEAFGGASSGADRARRLYEWGNRDELIPDQRLFGQRMSQLTSPNRSLLMSRLRFAETPRVVGELQRLPRGVEAIFFARRTDGAGSERPVGLCLVALESATTTPGQQTVVTVDFGTTNTVAYAMLGGTKSLVSFKERVVFPIATAKASSAKEDLATEYETFFPLKDHDTPIPTVVRKRNYQGDLSSEIQGALRSVKVEHGFTDVAFFMPDFLRMSTQYDAFLSGRLVGGIKWADDAPTRLLAIRFIRQLMMMISAELVASGHAPEFIEWRFSYPQAFGPDKKGQLKGAIQNAWDELFGASARAIQAAAGEGDKNAPTKENRIKLFTESEASAHYFMYDEQKTDEKVANKLMLMLDIGGGTTDLAIWFEKEMRWRNSFRLAGGDFFTRYLMNNRQILDAIGFQGVTAAVQTDNVKITGDFAELFISAPQFNENFVSGLPALAVEPWGAGLRHCATAALGGLAHYAGVVLRRLIKDGVIARSDLDLNTITVAFGGRGSGIFRQFDIGDRYNTELTPLLRMVIAAADSEHDATQTRADSQFSRQPKHEVARGMLITPRGDPRPDSVAAPLGEIVSFTNSAGEAVTTNAEDDVSILLGGRRVSDSDLTEFKAFLASLRKFTGLSIDIEAHGGEGRRIIGQAVSDQLRSLQDLSQEEDPDVQVVEPPFITELRALIRLMSLPVDTRDTTLTVKTR